MRLPLVIAALALALSLAQPVGAWTMLAYGDSLSADTTPGLTMIWCGARTPVEHACEPRGVSGETYATGVPRLIADIDAGLVSPDLDFIVLGWGANDLRRGGWDAETQIFEHLRRAAEAVLAAGPTPVLWVPNPQFELAVTPFEIDEQVDERIGDVVAPYVRSLAIELDVPVVDLYAELWAIGFPEMSNLYRDHVHLNSDGNDWLAEAVTIAVPEPRAGWMSLVALGTVGLVGWMRKGVVLIRPSEVTRITRDRGA